MSKMSSFTEQLQKMKAHPGFIAALDQSGGSTPKALQSYGIKEDAWSNEAEMFGIVHRMRTRIITSPSFTGERILGAILFENTMDRSLTPCWMHPFGVSLRRPTPNLDSMENAGVCDDRLSHVVGSAKARSQVGRGAQSLPVDPASGYYRQLLPIEVVRCRRRSDPPNGG
jgi:hypothetical protein